MKIRHIISTDENGGYSRGGETPWQLPGELAAMRSTMEKFGGIVLLGRATWLVIEQNARHKNALNPSFGKRHLHVVSSRSLDLPPGVIRVADIDNFVKERQMANQDFWVASGGLYADKRLVPDEVWRTAVKGDYGCDAFYTVPATMRLMETSDWHEENGSHYRYELYERLQLGSVACENIAL
ncbi:dihydrofolate reductase [Candidatus Saccharibacteria bacterium]|jgi:dihydrofolate reductase|nr:dihydrofolate reductase [Candidatus Saccharibacteria bacterium]HPR09125.1 dihydrofolate reductase [Candidatus Saccharibacteria bacterium]